MVDKRIIDKRRIRKIKNKEKRLKKLKILKYIIPIGIILFILINKFILSIVTVEGRSMELTLREGSNIIVSKVRLGNDLKRNDIVIFVGNDDRQYIKRIIGLPGEFIQIDQGKVYVNGQELDEPYTGNIKTEVYNANKWRVGEDEYFVLGDNRRLNDSKDSRIFGNVKENQIIGKMIYKLGK